MNLMLPKVDYEPLSIYNKISKQKEFSYVVYTCGRRNRMEINGSCEEERIETNCIIFSHSASYIFFTWNRRKRSSLTYVWVYEMYNFHFLPFSPNLAKKIKYRRWMELNSFLFSISFNVNKGNRLLYFSHLFVINIA